MIRAWFLRTALLVLLFGLGPGAQARSGFAGLAPGPHAVGFRVVPQYDYARTYAGNTDAVTGQPTTGERARPLQTLVWYPAPTGGTPLRYADYLRTEATDLVFERSEAEVAAFMATKRQWTAARVGPAETQRLFDQRMGAVRNAPAAAGRFPVVLYTPGRGGTAHEVADLGEYLASHGYVMLATRSLGTRTSLMNTDLQGLDSQVRDFEFLLAYARTLPQADLGHVAAMGWSWGGLANVVAATQDARITALVSFDGTREPTFTRPLPVTQLTVPWLYIQRRAQTVSELSKEGIETSFSLLNAATYANVYQLVMHPMEHVDFSAAMLRAEPPAYFAEYSRAEVETAYRWTCRYTLEFLNAYLKGDAAGQQFLDRRPAENGVPAHTASLRHRPAQAGPVPTQAGFAAALSAEGFDHALAVYRRVQQQDPTFALAADDLNAWGYQLLNDAQRRPEARAIFQLGTELYPTDANLFDSLGEADERNQDPAAARTHYRRSLDLNPQNANARQRLQALGTPSGAPAN